MRTTLTIDDDVLAAAKGLAARENRTVGEVVSDLARRSLQSPALSAGHRNGVPLLPTAPGARPVTMELVNELRDSLP